MNNQGSYLAKSFVLMMLNHRRQESTLEYQKEHSGKPLRYRRRGRTPRRCYAHRSG